MSRRSLFDVNVLLALIDADHDQHDRAHAWFAATAAAGWASCAITQNGAVRILSQPGYSNAVSTAEAAALVGASCSSAAHEFWPCDRSLLDEDVVVRTRLLGPGRVTDVYLLALAVQRDGRLVTFDRSVDVGAVVGAGPEHLDVI